VSRPIIQLEGVSVCYGDEFILREVDLDLMAGEVAAVVSIDTSGGLTTLLKTAAGLKPPTAGRVLFNGQDVYAMGYGADQKMRKRIGVVLEGGALHPNRNVWDNVAFPLRYHGERRGGDLNKTVERLLSDCGFNEDPKLFPWQISARGRKLAGLARALSRDPEIVIIDRFFEGLEMPDWRRLFELVMELNHHQGVSWLLISEVDAAIFQVAERVGVLRGGELIGYDHRRRLFEQPEIREAFEEAEAKPMRTRTQRAKALNLNDISSQEVSLDISSAPLDSASALEGDLTINIDGRLPRGKVKLEEDGALQGDLTIDLGVKPPKAPFRPARSLDRARSPAGPTKAPLPTPTNMDATIFEPPPPGTVDDRSSARAKREDQPLGMGETFYESSVSVPAGAEPAADLQATFYESSSTASVDAGLREPATPTPPPSLEDTSLGGGAPLPGDSAEEAKTVEEARAEIAREAAAEAARAKRRAAKKTVQAPAPTLSDPAQAARDEAAKEARAKRKAAKKTVQAPAPTLSDPAAEAAKAEAARAKRKAAKKTVQAPAPTLSDPAAEAAAKEARAKRKAAKKTVQAPAPTLSDPAAEAAAKAARAKRKAAKKTVQAPAPTLSDPAAEAAAKAARAKRKAAKKTVQAPPPADLEDSAPPESEGA
jgi:ABC-type transporter Mla maintaining outer membrane lipid asymmetry ATPase subunit MlaF